jgi:Phage tail protein (Tail_P2_I)
MTLMREELLQLLPRLYRQRDAEPAQGGVLEALLEVLGEQGDLVARDVDQLYDDAFIETCAEWVVPYLGDLLGVRLLHPLGPGAGRQRALVANTLDYRRRKGTLAALEDLAWQVTGWPTAAVEYFQRLGVTQHLSHLRLANVRTPDLRRAADLELVGGPFSPSAHTAEVRRVPAGRYSIQTIGLHVWRLQAQPVVRASARPVTDPSDGRFHIDPVGLTVPLFNSPVAEPSIDSLARESDVPAPLRRRALYDELEAMRAGSTDRPRWFGDTPVIEVFADTGAGLAVVPLSALTVADLADPPAPTATGWPRPAAPIIAAVDPVLGRLSFRDGLLPTTVEVSATIASPGRVGAGTYARDTVLPTNPDSSQPWFRAVGRLANPVPGRVHTTLTEALTDWQATPAGTVGVIALLDSRTYVENLDITVPAGSELTIAAVTWPQAETAVLDTVLNLADADPAGRRPHLRGSVTVRGTTGAADALRGELTLDGLLVEGDIVVARGDLGRLTLCHTTVVPGIGSVTVEAPSTSDDDNGRLVLELTRAITGPIAVPARGPTLDVANSIIDGGGATAVAAAFAPACLDQVTVLGALTVDELFASECLFTGLVTVTRRQSGCLRFSYVSEGAVAPRRYRCQPDLALTDVTDAALAAAVRARMNPIFTSTTFGHPAYGRLDDRADTALLTGASNGAAMGSFAELQEPQRLANLTAVLEEYLRLGLEAGVIHET